jgi:hypothetical protein
MGLWEVLEGMWPGEPVLDGGGSGGGGGGSSVARGSGELGAQMPSSGPEQVQVAQRRAAAAPGQADGGSGAGVPGHGGPAGGGGPPPLTPSLPRPPEEDEGWLFREDAREDDGEAQAAAAAAAAARAAREEAAVTAGVLYCLHCLHQTQHLSPRAAVYAPLTLLQLLTDRVPALVPAGAGDAVLALRALLRSGAVVPGAARRPAGRVAPSAGKRAGGRGGWQGDGAGGDGAVPPWAVAPSVQRSAIFHVKAGLKGLANFQRLQSLCDAYGAARAAVFGPLGMRAGEGPPRASPAAARPSGVAAALVLPSWAAEPGSMGHSQLAQMHRAEQEQQGQGGRSADDLGKGPRPAAEEQQPMELFDSRFGTVLQRLAIEEAAALLGALRPARPAGRSTRRRRRAPDTEGDEDGTAERRPRLADDAMGGSRVLTGMAARLYGHSAAALQPASSAGGAVVASEGTPAVGGREQQGRQQQGRERDLQGRRQPGNTPGGQLVLHTADLAAIGLAPPAAAAPAAAATRELAAPSATASHGVLAGSRGFALALAAREERQQRAVQCADSWFAAHDRLLSGRPVVLQASPGPPPEEEGQQQQQRQRRRTGAGAAAEGTPPPTSTRGRSTARGGRSAGPRPGGPTTA